MFWRDFSVSLRKGSRDTAFYDKHVVRVVGILISCEESFNIIFKTIHLENIFIYLRWQQAQAQFYLQIRDIFLH